MLPSPFIIRKELAAPGYFYGRKREIENVLSYLNKDNPQNVQLIGQRRIGKSFLLQYLALSTDTLLHYFGEHLDQFTIVYWNLARRPPDTPQQFYLDLIRIVKAKLPEALADTFLLEAASADELDEVIDEALQTLEDEDHHVVLLLDEFSIITANPAYPATFFSRLRTLAEGSALAFVIATHRPLSELCHSGDVADSPFFNIFTKVPIGLLGSEEAETFLTAPFAQRHITFAEDAVTEVLRLSGGHPAILATLGEMLWSRASDGEKITQPFVAGFQRNLYTSFEDDFAYYWQYLSEAAQQVGIQLTKGQIFSWPPATNRATFQELESRAIIRNKKGRAAIFGSLFEEYIQQHGLETFNTFPLFKDEPQYYPLIADVLRARLKHAPQLPTRWQADIEYAVNSLEDHPEQACFCCGRTLFRKILEAISSVTGIPLQRGEGSSHEFLNTLRHHVPQPGYALPASIKPFNRLAYQELWYLKHLGDCGAHADEYHLSRREATEGIFLAITLCQHLVLEGYAN